MTHPVALRCWSNNEHYNADFDYGIVDVTPELLADIERRRKLFVTAHAEDKSLSRMAFWDSSPWFRAEADLEMFADNSMGEDDELQPQWFQNLANGAESEDLPLDFVMPADKDGDFRTECDRMNVTELGVYWTVVPKHSSLQINTGELSYRELDAILGREVCEECSDQRETFCKHGKAVTA